MQKPGTPSLVIAKEHSSAQLSAMCAVLIRGFSGARAVKGMFGEALKGGRAAAVITGLTVCPEGLVSACLDGTLRLHPLL